MAKQQLVLERDSRMERQCQDARTYLREHYDRQLLEDFIEWFTSDPKDPQIIFSSWLDPDAGEKPDDKDEWKLIVAEFIKQRNAKR